MSSSSGEGGVERLLRELAPRVLGALTRRFGDFPACEDAVQEALLAAASRWPAEGFPDNPMGWLVRVASRRLADHRRSESARRRREEAVARDVQVERTGMAPEREEEDDTLVLLFMCCHPSLTPSSAVALTLRAVGGLDTGEIARAYLVPEATMAQRITRAKRTVAASGVPFRLPTPGERGARLAAVLHVLYLIFNEGYTASSGTELARPDLSAEAVRLARALREQLPEEPEVAGLLALMLLTDARRAARTGPRGELIPLHEQDRALWDRERIAEGTALLERALPRGAVGPYQLQAAIAALHDEAPTAEDTDWPQILALYGLLERVAPSPMVTLSRAVALAMVRGPRAGLALVDALARRGDLEGHHRLEAVRAHLLERNGDRAAAARHYRAAAGLTTNLPERDYLLARATRLGAGAGESTAEAAG